MKHQEGNFQNKNGQTLYYQSWLPEGKAKACVLVVHGMNEHSGRYKNLAAYLTKSDYAVYSLDLPGHGKTEGIRSYVEDLQDFFDALTVYLDMIQDWQPALPVYLIGHSMGGCIAASYLTTEQDRFKGAVLSGALVKVPDYVSNFTLQLGKIISALFPKLRLIPLDAEGISRDPAVVEAYLNDPLVFTGKITARISNELNKAIALIEEEGHKIEIPLFLIHGSADSLCDPAWSQYLHDLVSSQDKELKIYDGLYHEVFNEPEAEIVYADVLSWLEGRRD